ncbi:MAG: GNAT family N-acetyltransferase [Planctomycetota bacterium]
MEIVPLADEHKQLYFCCLEDWSEEATREAGPRREFWYEKMMTRGLRVLIAKDDRGEVGGMIQYLPIEHSTVDGNDLYFVYCIWVHGHKQGRGNFQKHGMGKALLLAAEKDARELGAKGMAAWGLWLPFWMRASWFKKQGYFKADRQGLAVLLWKSFADGATPPRWFKSKRRPELVPGKVKVTAFVHGWCMGQNLAYERAKRAAAEFGDKVLFCEIDALERQTMLEWGHADALFIDDQQVRTGPPPSYEKIRRLIARKVGKL